MFVLGSLFKSNLFDMRQNLHELSAFGLYYKIIKVMPNGETRLENKRLLVGTWNTKIASLRHLVVKILIYI
jgi:hypothetical protein